MGRRIEDSSQEEQKEDLGFRCPDPESEQSDEIKRTKRKKRTFTMMQYSDEEEQQGGIDFDIMEFAEKFNRNSKQQVYTILTFDQREHKATLQEIECVAKRDEDTLNRFVTWLGGESVYKEQFDKKVPKLAPNPLPAKRARKELVKQDLSSSPQLSEEETKPVEIVTKKAKAPVQPKL